MPQKQSSKGPESERPALRRRSSESAVDAGERNDRLMLEFTGEIFQWRGPAPYHFVGVPEEQTRQLKAVSSGISYYRGIFRVLARIGDVEWTTSLWPKDGRYLVPIKDMVRKPMGLAAGDAVTIGLTVAALEKRPDPARVRSTPANQNELSAARRHSPPHNRDSRGGAGAVSGRKRPQVTDDQLRIVPANEATWEDLQAVFGERGASSVCWCQRYKMQPRERCISTVGAAELAPRLREQTACGRPDSTETTGIVAYLDGEPVGWCAVNPRSANARLLSQCPTPWVGRTEDKTDDSVWAVTCILTRAGYRRRGISRALARAAVDFARQQGARALEAYPHTTEFAHFGTPGVFAAAGLAEVSRPTLRRIVMRIDFRRPGNAKRKGPMTSAKS